MDRKVIIFGTGGVGKTSKDYLIAAKEDVMAFADNDPEKQGTEVEGIPVISPDEIRKYEYDYVVLGLFKNRVPVTEQLKGLGIPEDRIVTVIEQRHIFKNPEKLRDDELIRLSTSNYESKRQKQYESWGIKVDDEQLLIQLKRLKDVLFSYKIPLEKVCIVKGMVMVAHGIRQCKRNEDLDIIMTSDLRKLYGSGKVFIDDNIEMDPIYYMHGRNNDDIIMDPERHIVFNGLKVMTVEEMYAYKREMRLVRSDRKGLREDLELMRGFLESHNIDVNSIDNQYATYHNLPNT